MADKMRLTAHNGRTGKHGTYSAKHNDRNFDARQAEHIDEDRSKDNWYWHCYQKESPGMTFEDAEALYYERHFREALDNRNKQNIKARHPERVKTMDDYRTSKKSCPEEQILQIGRKDMSVNPETLKQIAIEQINWEQKRFPGFRLLDVALHVDEEGAPHIHRRGVWVAHDDKGREVVGQAKALAEMGITAPDPSKKCSKYNNPKMTHTKECREHLAEVCRKHGLDLELTPREHSRSGLALEEYRARQEQEKLRQAQQALDEAKAALKDLGERQQELAAIEAQIGQVTEQLRKILELKAKASIIKKPGLFNKDDIVTYHKNSLVSTEAIGREAQEHLTAANRMLLDVTKREVAVADKEKAINPLYDRAQELKDRQESYILEKAQAKFDSFIQEQFGQELTGRSTRGARLERFCDSLTMKDGRTVLDAFEQQEQHRKAKLMRAWEKDNTLD